MIRIILFSNIYWLRLKITDRIFTHNGNNIRRIDSTVRNNILQLPYIMINNQITSVFAAYIRNISLMIAEAP